MTYRLFLSATFFLVGLCLATTHSTSAQDTFGVVNDSLIHYDEVSAARPILMSAGLGAAGFLVGGLAGGLAASDCYGDQCVYGGVIAGGVLGLAVGASTGAHLGNRRRGSLAIDVLASVGGAAAGVGLSSLLFEDNGNAFLLAIPVLQVAAAVTAERMVSAKRRKGVHLRVMPTDSGLSLSLTVGLDRAS